ncbi:MAG: hypothetical protein HY303_16865 [Candidatus Wallbacteria bacterium]|nr:hypothetical protein [Candidatus Wallbacteria bacterium]
MAVRLAAKLIQGCVDTRHDRVMRRVNAGGGTFLRRHWQVLDWPSPAYRFLPGVVDFPFNLASQAPLPFDTDSVTLFYSSHTLEHIPQEFCQHVLDEFFRCLSKGGAVRLTMPDFGKACAAFEAADERFFSPWHAPGRPLERSLLAFFASWLRDRVPAEQVRADFESFSREQFGDRYSLQVPRESQAADAGNHINWWTVDKTLSMLRAAGFEAPYVSAPQESRFPEMRGTPWYGAFDTSYPAMSLFVEAVK